MTASVFPAVILAGGQARRMGGGDKCRLTVGGKTILSHCLARLEGQAAPVAINANGDPRRFADTGLIILPDTVPGQPGPLAGILAAMLWARGLGAAHVLTVAGDTPFFPTDLTARLLEVHSEGGIALAASAAPGGQLRTHPVFGLWPVALAEDLHASLESGLRKIVLWTGQHQAQTAVFTAPSDDPFHNINTASDIAAAEAMI